MGIEEVSLERRDLEHEDYRRGILTIFNADLGDFAAKQVKILEGKEITSQELISVDGKIGQAYHELGGHYHEYTEVLFMQSGEARFELEDIETNEQAAYRVPPHGRLVIPPGVAHRAFMKPNSLLIGCTAEPYISPKHNDKAYAFEE